MKRHCVQLIVKSWRERKDYDDVVGMINQFTHNNHRALLDSFLCVVGTLWSENSIPYAIWVKLLKINWCISAESETFSLQSHCSPALWKKCDPINALWSRVSALMYIQFVSICIFVHAHFFLHFSSPRYVYSGWTTTGMIICLRLNSVKCKVYGRFIKLEIDCDWIFWSQTSPACHPHMRALFFTRARAVFYNGFKFRDWIKYEEPWLVVQVLASASL